MTSPGLRILFRGVRAGLDAGDEDAAEARLEVVSLAFLVAERSQGHAERLEGRGRLRERLLPVFEAAQCDHFGHRLPWRMNTTSTAAPLAEAATMGGKSR